MGGFYERIPQFKTGVQFHVGELKIQPEVALVLSVGGTSGLTTDQHLRFGDSVGAESDQPGLEARVVFQFPLSHNWRGVAPAQLIFSGHHSRMNEMIPHAAQVVNETAPTCLPFPAPLLFSTAPPFLTSDLRLPLQYRSAKLHRGFRHMHSGAVIPVGTQAGNPQNIYSTELQLPTPWVTFDAKFYRGNDMRFFFGGQLNDVFSNLQGLFEVGNGVSESRTSHPVRLRRWNAADLLPEYRRLSGYSCTIRHPSTRWRIGWIRGVELPALAHRSCQSGGPNSGWILHLMWGTDRANYAEASAR